MADLLIHEHKKNDAGSYDNVYRKTKAKMVETEDGGTAEQKLSDAANHIANRENPHGTTAELVGADPSGSASQALQDAKNYTDQKIEEIPIPDVSEQINTHNTSSDAHANMGWITSDDSAPDDPVPVNADTLGGISAEDYATKVYADTAAYEKAKEQGYTGTEAEFYAALGGMKDAPFLSLKGGAMSGTINMGSHSITNLPKPSSGSEPLRKDDGGSAETLALFGLGTDAVPDDVLALLSKAALYKTVGQAAQLSTFPEGSIIYLNENGSPVQFYVAKHDYESNLNGVGRTLVVRKDVYDQRQWHSSNVNAWASCAMRSWLNSAYKTLLDAPIREAIGTTIYRYTPGNGNTTVSTRSDAVFLLSFNELGKSHPNANKEGSVLPIASTLQIAYQEGRPTYQWTRTPITANDEDIWHLRSDGQINATLCTKTYGSRPAFTLPSNLYVSDDGHITFSGLYDVSGNLLLKLPGVKIATGSYVGTGTYGASNPNSLTFEFEPKFVFVSKQSSYSAGYGQWLNCYIWIPGVTGIPVNNTSNSKFDVNGNTLSWYSTNDADTQLNSNNTEYVYYAIG